MAKRVSVMESRTEFLNNEEVKAFINHFSDLITGEKPFEHEYKVRDKRLPEGYRKKYLKNTDGWLEIKCLEGAFKRYWAFRKDFKQHSDILKPIKEKAKTLKDEGNNADYSRVIKDILKWGEGGNGGQSIFKSNWKWAEENEDKIAEIMLLGIEEMQSETPETSIFYNKKGKDAPRMNAGYSKFYSVACDNVIIYDSRVAAALGLIVKRYLKEKDVKEIPPLLHFRWGASQGQTMRNPGNSTYDFKGLNNDAQFWAECNIRANWLIRKALDEIQPTPAWLGDDDHMRKVEAALFVIGYDVKPTKHDC